jgi:signal transduction histidine kinase/DNA-binding response OmpR family regulator
VKYQYQLEGLDRTWSSMTSNTFAQYGNLSPGRYTFKVKAINSQRQWSQVSEYSFTIRPPWWLTWWAFALYAALVAAASFSALMIYKRRLLLRHQLKTEHDEAKRLRELDTFKSQLFTNLTHEFRTPLTVILGMARQLTGGKWKSGLDEQESTRVTKGLQMIENNGKNLLQLINQLLDLSKLENSSFRLYPVQSDIVTYVRYVTESFKSYAEDLQIKIRFHADAQSLIMDFDPEQMRYVLTNLISNALKFTPPGGEVSVNVSEVDGAMQLVVKDTGVGIAAQDLPYVMDRFYQADSSNTRTAHGTGIGLAHTKELLKMMDGSIDVESELGKGTRVRIRIPVKRESFPAGVEEMTMPSKPHLNFTNRYAKPSTTDTDSNGHASPHEFELPQLLIIEDNTDVVEYLTSCFEYEYGITVAYDGKEGVEKAFDVIPDIIISDVMMPELDGFQVCDRLKQDERTSHIPILLLTAKVDAASRLQGLRRGADAYVAKPFDPKELILQIAVMLENRRRMASYFSKSITQPAQQHDAPASIAEDIQIEDVFMQKVRSVIAANYHNEDFSLPLLCRHLGMSRSQLFRKLRAIADTTPSDMIRTYRLQKAKALLEKGDISIAEVAYQVGFKAPSYFSKLFHDEFGVQPSEIAK